MLFAWLVGLTACDDTTFNAHFEMVEGEGIEAVADVFDGNCVGCHMGPDGAAGVSLDGNFCDQTIDVEAQSGTGLLIVAGNKEDSVLYQRIIDASRPMPPNGLMAGNNIDIVGQWIDDGADCSGLDDVDEDEQETTDVDVDGDGPEAEAAQVFANACVDCHNGNRPSGGVGLDGNLCDDVVNQVGSSGQLLVVPNDAEGSLLYKRMLDEVLPMPPNGLLEPSLTDVVKDWINNGAECGEDSSDPNTEDEPDGDGEGAGNDEGGAESDEGIGDDDPGTSGSDDTDSTSGDDTGAGTSVDEAAPEPVPSFTDVYVILDSESTHCTACHDDTRPAGGLSLFTEEEAYANLLADPEGVLEPLVIPGDAEGSALVLMMRGDAGYSPMPPTGEPHFYSLVSPVILGVVTDWINGGAPE